VKQFPAVCGSIASSRRRSSYQTAVLADNPVAYWPLNDASGAFVDLVSGLQAAANGTITRQVSTGLTKLGTGASFGGTTADYAEVASGSAGSLNITGDVTYEAWIKPSGGAGANRLIASKGNTATNGGYGMWINTSNKLLFSQVQAGVSLVVGGTTLSVGTLYYVVVTRSGNNYVAYVNATSDGTNTSAQAINGVATPFDIAIWNNNNSRTLPFPGLIADVAIYNAALSPTRITAHYNAAN